MHKIIPRRIDQDMSEEAKKIASYISVSLEYFKYASLNTENFFVSVWKIFPLLVLCGCKTLSTSDWLNYFSFLLVKNGEHVFFVQQNKASQLVRTIALDLLRGKQCRRWERRKKEGSKGQKLDLL